MKTLLNGSPGYMCCGAFGDGNNLIEDIEACAPDVILMDIEMPGINGIDATLDIRKRFPHVRVLIQTVFDDGERIFQALCAGASGYILKNDPLHVYLEGITETFNGGAPMSSLIAKKVMGFFTNRNVILITGPDKDYQLSPREKELLSLMIDGHDLRSIAEQSFISYNTVRSHVQHIYQKLHVANRNEAIMKAIQHGLV